MPEVHQHPDGLVYVRAPGGTYADTPANFVTDFGEQLLPPPNGADEQLYDQGRRHCFMGSGDVIEGGPLPWEAGDRIIWKIAQGLSAQAARVKAALSPLPTVPQMISDRQFFQQLAIQGIISQDEALASNAAVIPPPLLAIIDAMPADQQFGAKMIISGATIYNRTDPLTIGIGTAYGWTSAQIDAFFQAAAVL